MADAKSAIAADPRLPRLSGSSLGPACSRPAAEAVPDRLADGLARPGFGAGMQDARERG
jgi:hypothetical protein